MSKKEIVSKVPAITPELLTQNQAFQEQLSEKFNIRQESASVYGAQVVKQLVRQLTRLETGTAAGVTGDKDLWHQRRRQLITDIAAWAASIGEYSFAAMISEDPRLIEMAAAEDRAVAEWCEHPYVEFKDGHVMQNAFRVGETYSFNEQQHLSVIQCRECGFTNSMPLPDELKVFSDVRAEAVKTGKDVSREAVEEQLQQLSQS